MKPYGYQKEPSGVRVRPDKADISHLGLSSKHGKLPSRAKRAARRIWKKAARRASKILGDE